ncbi:hypothetical protein GBO37_18820 [Paracoccus sp. 08]|uniref:Uncharacterized protein n=1 Tax=Paracoccus hibiscisoli TaxID=2023261 RepID=A0A4U0QJX0_9RHOB|nr:hypothetical protein [Paracoccus sp. 08]TJZ81993.1 hypothetical protein FA740_16015 [Paracoccus hibiscisoli]
MRCRAAAPFCLNSHGFHKTSSAIAKYADALRRISLACLSSRFSRSKALIRAFSSLVGPDSSPASRAARRYQSRRLKDEQHSFEAIAR